MAKKRKKKKFYVRNLISTLLMVFAVGLLFYPIVVNYYVAQQNTTTVQNYQTATDKLGPAQTNKLLASARVYNDYIYSMSQHKLWTQVVPDYKKQLVTDNTHMMGYLTIPQIKVENVPVYSGVSEQVLAAGVGHIPQTSLPIGGVNSHAVLSAHSGRVNNSLFSDLQDLKLGDVFYIHVLNLNLKYQIDDRRIVEPDNVSSLSVVPGKDLATLVTCWPTGINNKRLLVTGHRVPYSEKLPQESIQRNQFGYDFWVMLGSALLVLIALLYIAWRYYKRYKKKRKQ